MWLDKIVANPSTSFRQSRCNSLATANQLISCAPAADIRCHAESRVINVPADLIALPSMDWYPPSHHVWSLIGPAGEKAKIAHEPRYLTDDLTALCQAAIAGVGIVQLPCMACYKKALNITF